MANNLVVQLLLKTGTFSTDLKTAKGQIQNFQRDCNTAGRSLSAFGNSMGLNIGSLTKFGSALGVAALAGKELKAVIDSSQTSADAFEGAIAGCKGVLDSFNTAIATADFSSFSNGLWSVFEAAKAVQEALDQLGNTQIAYDYMSKENQTKFQEAYNIFKSPESTEQMKADAIKQMKEAIDAQFTYAKNYGGALYNTYVAQVVKKAGSANLPGGNVTMDQFRRAMEIDLGLRGDPEKARENINKSYQNYLRDRKRYGNSDDIRNGYKDIIAIHAMLELMKGDELKGIAQLLMGMQEANQVALNMEKTFNRVTGSKTTTKTTKADVQQMIDYSKGVELIKGQILPALVSSTPLGLAGEGMEKSANQLRNSIKILSEYRDKLKEGDPLIEWYKKRLKELGDRLKDITQLDISDSIPTPSSDSTSAWDKFNQSMSQTATIVSTLTNTFKEGSEVTAASILQMVATSLPAIGSLISSIQALTTAEAIEAGVAATGKAVSSSKHWIEAIAAVASLGAVVATAIAAASTPKMQKFASGGIVGGSSYTGDRVTANVNSGEMILNKTQQANLFRMANGGVTGGNQVEFHICGTDLVGVLNNNNRKNRLIR